MQAFQSRLSSGLIFIFLLSTLNPIFAQIKEEINQTKSINQLNARFSELVESAETKRTNEIDKPCATSLNDLKSLIDPEVPLTAYPDGDFLTIESKLTTMPPESQYDKEYFNTIADKALDAYSKSNSYEDFVTEFTGKSVKELGTQNILPPQRRSKLTEAELIKSVYNDLRDFERGTHSIGNLSKSTTEQGCEISYMLKMKIVAIKYPDIERELIIEGTYTCSCEIESEKLLKNASFTYTARTKGIITYDISTFERIKNPSLEITNLECCPEKISAPPFANDLGGSTRLGGIGLGPDTTDAFSPGIYGGSIGLGYESDRSATSICVGGDYLHKIASNEKAIILAGGQLQFETESQGSDNAKFTQTLVSVGPKVEAHLPQRNSSTLPYVGFGVNYGFGSSKNQSFKDDQTQWSSSLYVGASTELNNDLGLFIQADVLGFDATTSRNDQGGEFKSNNFFFNLLKFPSVKVIVRKVR